MPLERLLPHSIARRIVSNEKIAWAAKLRNGEPGHVNVAKRVCRDVEKIRVDLDLTAVTEPPDAIPRFDRALRRRRGQTTMGKARD